MTYFNSEHHYTSIHVKIGCFLPFSGEVGHWVMKVGHDILLTLNDLHAKFELYPSINNKDMALLHINELLIATN